MAKVWETVRGLLPRDNKLMLVQILWEISPKFCINTRVITMILANREGNPKVPGQCPGDQLGAVRDTALLSGSLRLPAQPWTQPSPGSQQLRMGRESP